MCALVAAIVKTQGVFSSHGGFLACVKLESPFNKSAEKMLIYKKDSLIYYIPITDMTLELSVFWPSDTESRITELRFSESISLSFKSRLTSVSLLLRRRYVK